MLKSIGKLLDNYKLLPIQLRVSLWFKKSRMHFGRLLWK